MAGFTEEDKKQELKEKKVVKKVIRTYRDIAMDTLGSNPTSLAKMIVEEKKKKDMRRKVSIENPKNQLLFILSIILGLLGVLVLIGIVYLYINKTKLNKEQSQIKISEIKTLISYDYWKEVDLVDDEYELRDTIKDIVKNTAIPDTNLKNIIFKIRDDLGYAKQATSNQVMRVLNLRVDDSFYSDLTGKFTFGVVNIGANQNKTFAVFGVYNTGSSVVNMWNWEKTMLYDIGDIFQVDSSLYGREFRDIQLYNQSIRAVLDNQGKIVLGYTFIRPKIIAIFNSGSALKIILTKLEVLERK